MVSPDGKNVYVASYPGDALAVFDRGTATGALHEKPGAAGCLAMDPGRSGCAKGRDLEGPSGIAVSPDGKNVYVAGEDSDAVVVFERNPGTGALTQERSVLSVKSPISVVVSPDGKNVYVAASGPESIVIFDRDLATGGLTRKLGADGCISASAAAAECQPARGLFAPVRLLVSPDGKDLYVTSFRSAPGISSSVTSFARDPLTGELRQMSGAAGCVVSRSTAGACQEDKALEAPWWAAVSPDGRNVYVASVSSHGTLSIFDRDPLTGALTWNHGTGGCISRDAAVGPCQQSKDVFGAGSVAVSPDGRNVYVANSRSKAVVVFDRDLGTGALREKRGLPGCIAQRRRKGRCRRDAGLQTVFDISVSPDGRNVYVSSLYPATISTFGRSTR